MDNAAFARLATTSDAEVVSRDRVMDHAIHEDWGKAHRGRLDEAVRTLGLSRGRA